MCNYSCTSILFFKELRGSQLHVGPVAVLGAPRRTPRFSDFLSPRSRETEGGPRFTSWKIEIDTVPPRR